MNRVRLASRKTAYRALLLLGAATVLPVASAPLAIAQEAPTIDVTEITIADIQAAFAAGTYTSEQLTQAFLDRIAEYEPYYNAFTFMNPSALDDARAIDARRAAGEELGPLAGVPVVIKEAMDVAGIPSTAGWTAFAPETGVVELVPELDSTVVARLREAGAVILGKTNIPTFSNSGSNANSSWDGPTFNAVNRDFAPGGSSAGSATAIAASFAVIALAEETGGSIQNPSGAQSIVGVKTTFALVPNVGVVPLAGSTRDVVGPFARTVTDAAIALDVLAGYSSEDPKTVASIGNIPAGGYTAGLSDTALEGARVGLYGPGWLDVPLSEETVALYANVIAELEAEGAIVVEDPFLGSNFNTLGPATGYDSRGTESLAYDLNSYLGHLGPDAPTLDEMRAIPDADPFAEGGSLAYYLSSLPVLAESLDDPTVPPDLSEFLEVREAYLATFRSVMEENDLDLLVLPQVTQEPGAIFGGGIDSTTVSEIDIAGLPGVIMPAGAYESGAAFAVIFIGDTFSEGELLGYAYDYEQATNHRIVPVLATEPYPMPAE